MTNERKLINSYFKKKGIRLTPQRQAIVNTLLENKIQHISVAEIYDLLKKKDESVGLATIYRTLSLLENEGLVAKRDFGSDNARYEVIINQRKHNHLVCIKCGKIIETPDMLPGNIKEILLTEKDFYCLNYTVKFYGYCTECQEKMDLDKTIRN